MQYLSSLYHLPIMRQPIYKHASLNAPKNYLLRYIEMLFFVAIVEKGHAQRSKMTL
jgi:hypothetical protein